MSIAFFLEKERFHWEISIQHNFIKNAVKEMVTCHKQLSIIHKVSHIKNILKLQKRKQLFYAKLYER